MADCVAVLEMARALRTELVSFQPDDWPGEDCAVLAEELAAIEKVSAATRVRAATRAGSCGAHRERGFADVSDWMARATGSTSGSAKTALETIAALDAQPDVKAALDTGSFRSPRFGSWSGQRRPSPAPPPGCLMSPRAGVSER